MARSADSLSGCTRLSMKELSRIGEPSADFHGPAACQALRPWGKRGVTTFPRKTDHSSAETTPAGLAVPKYSSSLTARCSPAAHAGSRTVEQPASSAARLQSKSKTTEGRCHKP